METRIPESKFVIVLMIFWSMSFTSASQELYGVLSSGGSDGVGTIGHFNSSSSVWTTDYNFTTPFPGSTPKRTDLTEANGKFYGMIGGNGWILIEWDPITNAYTKKREFTSSIGVGAALVYHGGKLYGMTFDSIFEYDPLTNTYTDKYNFNFSALPQGRLTSWNNKLYGMTYSGGEYGGGIIFEWDPVNNVFVKRIDFHNAIGINPYGNLTFGGGKFYGMTFGGGAHQLGVFFEWDPTTNVLSKKVDFDGSNGGRSTGSPAYANGKVYGTTYEGGEINFGVLFEWDPASGIYTKRVDFTGPNGLQPLGSLIEHEGKLYGTTFYGGSGYGILFEWDISSNSFTKKYNFQNKADGTGPQGTLAHKDGKLYGFTTLGGTADKGVIFEWDFTTNHYTKKIDLSSSPEGNTPVGLVYAEGKLYGTTSIGGANGGGTLFEWDPTSKRYTTLHHFDCAKGCNPKAGISYANGKLYGITNQGAKFNNGGIFEWDINARVLSSKIEFEKLITVNRLTYHEDHFYGVEEYASTYARIFEWDPTTNVFTRKADFNLGSAFNFEGSLTYANGKFYGTASQGGSTGYGILFEWNFSTNQYRKLWDFSSEKGFQPTGRLEFVEGKLYGTTILGGGSNGVIFEWNTLTEVYTNKYNFNFNFSEGIWPQTSLHYRDGKLYGLTRAGGSTKNGVLFTFDLTTGNYNKKLDLSTTTGFGPRDGLVELIATPTVQATNIIFNEVQSTSINVHFTKGNGNHRLVVMRAGSRPEFVPIDNTAYSGDLGNGESVVFNGTGSSFNLAGLQSDIEYFITIFEFNTDGSTTRYLTTNAPVANLRKTIQDFSLYNFKTKVVVSTFDQLVVLDVADPDIEKYTIRANVSSEDVSSVKFTLDGRKINIDNTRPYTINQWELPVLSSGVHTLIVQAYSRNFAQGDAYETKEVCITITNSAAIVQFDIVDSNGNKIKTLFDGDVIDISQPEFNSMNIVAQTNINTTRSVKFTLNGVTARIDNRSPYAIKGTSNGYETPWDVKPGSYSLTATPYMKYYAWGPEGSSLAVHFTVVNQASLFADTGIHKKSIEYPIEVIGRENQKQLSAFPNPVVDMLNISLRNIKDDQFILKIMNLNAQVVYTLEGNAKTLQALSISTDQLGLRSGIYYIQLIGSNGFNDVTKFIKQ